MAQLSMLFWFDYIQICNKNTRSQTHVAICMLTSASQKTEENRTDSNCYCYLNIMIECQGTNSIVFQRELATGNAKLKVETKKWHSLFLATKLKCVQTTAWAKKGKIFRGTLDVQIEPPSLHKSPFKQVTYLNLNHKLTFFSVPISSQQIHLVRIRFIYTYKLPFDARRRLISCRSNSEVWWYMQSKWHVEPLLNLMFNTTKSTEFDRRPIQLIISHTEFNPLGNFETGK